MSEDDEEERSDRLEITSLLVTKASAKADAGEWSVAGRWHGGGRLGLGEVEENIRGTRTLWEFGIKVKESVAVHFGFAEEFLKKKENI